jgi:hypothetical protein
LNLDVELGDSLFEEPKQPAERALNNPKEPNLRAQLPNCRRDNESGCVRGRCDVACHCQFAFSPAVEAFRRREFFLRRVVAQKSQKFLS